jgi:hypothetical protein
MLNGCIVGSEKIVVGIGTGMCTHGISLYPYKCMKRAMYTVSTSEFIYAYHAYTYFSFFQPGGSGVPISYENRYDFLV